MHYEGRRKAPVIAVAALLTILAAAVFFCGFSVPANAAVYHKEPFVITIDPGHGAGDYGTTDRYKGKMYYEKYMTMTIAKEIRKELGKYRNVKVYMTRLSDVNVSLAGRADIAAENKSDLFFSVHINSKGDAQSYTDGASVLVSSGQYHKELAKSEWALGKRVLSNIEKKTGIRDRGLLKRTYSGMRYPNGKIADYYGIIRRGTEAGMVTVLTEHGFQSSSKDMAKMNTEAKLKKLGDADAQAIAEYYGLTKKSTGKTLEKKGVYVKFISQNRMVKDGKYFYVNKDETLFKGWKTIGKKRCHFGKTGAADTGQKMIGKATYQFTKKAGYMYKNKFGKANGKYYYYGSDGKALKSCTKKIGGKKYRFDKNGVCTNYR